jgi:hypothetical protein
MASTPAIVQIHHALVRTDPALRHRGTDRFQAGCRSVASFRLVARASSASQAHVTRILAKLGLRDRVPAAVLAHERGFIQAEPS